MRDINQLGECINCFVKYKDIESRLIFGNYIDNAKGTLCLPIYGIGKYLFETLENVKNVCQDRKDIQILISNNSAKSSDNINMENFIKKIGLKNVVYFQTDEPLNIFGNFNRCIELCQTEYLMYIHDDDLLIDDYMEFYDKAYAFLKRNIQVAMIHSKFISFYNHFDQPQRPSKYTLHKITNPLITYSAYSQTGIPSCGMIINKQAALDAGGFNDQFPCSGDAFLSVSMMKAGYEVYDSDVVLGGYRIGDNVSLKLETCKGFIIDDSIFMEWWGNKSQLRKIYYKILGNYIYSSNIKGKCATFAIRNSDITIQSLDYKKTFRNYGKFSLQNILYKVINRMVWLLVKKTVI